MGNPTSPYSSPCKTNQHGQCARLTCGCDCHQANDPKELSKKRFKKNKTFELSIKENDYIRFNGHVEDSLDETFKTKDPRITQKDVVRGFWDSVNPK